MSLLSLTLAWLGPGCGNYAAEEAATQPPADYQSPADHQSSGGAASSHGSGALGNSTQDPAPPAASDEATLAPVTSGDSTPVNDAPPPQEAVSATGPDDTSACELPDDTTPVFANHVFGSSQLSTQQRVLYTWTTNEQIEELRSGTPLLSRTEREGLGPGAAYEYFAAVSESEPIAALLASDEFARSRHAWVHPWATRMGWPGEAYGNQLLKIVVKADAWLAKVVQGTFTVWDLAGNPVATEVALASPERIGVVYFQKDSALGGAICGSFGFRSGPGFREYILNNPDMIEEWSHGTQDVLGRLESDLALVEAFAQRIRSCPVRSSPSEWNARLICNDFGGSGGSELAAYEQALALPSEYYLPTPANMVTLAETLQADLFEPDPLRWPGSNDGDVQGQGDARVEGDAGTE